MAKQTALVHLYVITVALLTLAITIHGFLQYAPTLEDQTFVKTHNPSLVELKFNNLDINSSLHSIPRFNNFTSVMASSHYNTIDRCWRTNPRWANDRMKLADCGVGYGGEANGGLAQGGQIYIVRSSEDDAVNPKPGTLRYGVTRLEPLWIVFAEDMNIILKMPLVVGSHKTIDGRGANIHISHGPCILLYQVHNVIIHGLNIHHCKPTNPGRVVWSDSTIQSIGRTDGDGICIKASKHIWVDHNTLSSSEDGLIDVSLASTYITISNNRFKHHAMVILLGHSDMFSEDKSMRVTIVYNHFGPGCVQRMPRVRFGYVHVVNNNYDPWGNYAIGGSKHPTIRSEGNHFVASSENFLKEVTKHICSGDGACKPQAWRWKSAHDVFMNGAYFVQSGKGRADPKYVGRQMFRAKKGKLVPYLTADAGSLRCSIGRAC